MPSYDEEIVFELKVLDTKAQKQVDGLTDSLKKASKAGQDIAISESFIKDVERSVDAVNDVNQALKDTGKTSKKEIGFFQKLLDGAKDKAIGLKDSLIETGKAAKKSIGGGASNIFKGLGESLQTAKDNANELKEGFANVFNAAKSGGEGAGDAIKGLGGTVKRLAVAGGPIGLAAAGLLAIGAAGVKAYASTEKGAKSFKRTINNVTNSAKAGWQGFIAAVAKGGEETEKQRRGLFAFIKDWKSAADEAKATFDLISEAQLVIDKVTGNTNIELQKLTNELEKQEIIASDTSISVEKQTRAINAAAKLKIQVAEKDLDLARKQSEAIILQYDLYRRQKRDTTELDLEALEAKRLIIEKEGQLENSRVTSAKERAERIQELGLRSVIQEKDALDTIFVENEKIFAREGTTIEELNKALQDNTRLLDESVTRRQQLISLSAGQEIDFRGLLDIKDPAQLQKEINSLGLSLEVREGLLDLIVETDTKYNDLADQAADTALKIKVINDDIAKTLSEEEKKALDNALSFLDKAIATNKKRQKDRAEAYNLDLAELDRTFVEEQTLLLKQLTLKVITEDEFAEKSLALELKTAKRRREILISGGQEVTGINKDIAEKELQVQREKDADLEELTELRQERIKKSFDNLYSFLEGSNERLSNLLSQTLDSELEAIDTRYQYELTRAEGNLKAIAAAESKQKVERLKAEADFQRQKANIQVLESATAVAKQTFDSLQSIKEIDDEKEKSKAIAIAGLEAVNAVQSGIFDFVEQKNQARVAQQLADFEAELEANKDNAQQVRILEARKQAFIEKEEVKQAKRRKARAITDALIATALASVKALPNLILSGIVAGIGLAQVAFIASQKAANGMLVAEQGAFLDGALKPLKFARGGMPHRGGIAKGKTHAQGGMKGVIRETGQPIEFERNEAIIKAPKGGDDGLNRTLSDINWMRGGVTFGFPAPSKQRQRNISVMKYAQGGIPNMKPIKYQAGGLTEAERQSNKAQAKRDNALINTLLRVETVMNSLPDSVMIGIENADIAGQVNQYNSNLAEEASSTTL